MTRSIRRAVYSFLFAIFTSSLVWAQATAQISGTVRDDGGAVLPGVTMTVSQTDTGFTRTVVTDQTGIYVLPNLPVGPYRLQAALGGFKSYERTGIVLQVGSSPTIDITLGIGALEETVSVEAAAPLVDTQRSGIGEVIESERIVELPLNGRNPVQLIELAGAAVPTGTASTRSFVGSSGGVEIAVAGGQSSGTAYLLDGAMHNNPYDNLNLPLPFPDALQEFRVETGALGAGTGVHAGASVSGVTKSGTNALHGSGFEFWRNHRFNATSPFALVGSDGKRKGDGLNRNQGGGTVGGPIQTDRLFFFGGYQGTFIRQTPTDNINFVPNAAMLSGDFTQAASAACNNGRPRDLGGPFVNNRVDPRLFSGAALALTRRLPTTTHPCGEVVWGFSDTRDEAQYVGRIDFQASQNHSFFGRYVQSNYDRVPPLRNTDNILASIPGGAENLAQALTIGETSVINSSTVNAIRFARNYTNIHRVHQGFFSGPDLGINMHSYQDDYFIIGVTGAFNVGSGVENEFRAVTTTYQAADDLTLVRGSHQMSFGGNVAFWDINHDSNVRSPGTFTVNGQVTGMALADFLLGNVSQFIQSAPSQMYMEQWYTGVYGSDTWRVNPRMTLNYGVRWEPFFPMQLVNGYVYNFSLDRFREGVKSTVYRNAPAGFLYPGDQGFVNGQAGMNKQWDNFAPRVGFAWDVTGDSKTSLRAGYSLGFDFVNGQYHLNTSVAPPWGVDVRVNATSLDNPFGPYPGGNPFPVTFDANAAFPVGGQYLAIDPDLKTTRKHSWNLVIERQVGSNMVVSATYLGNYTDNLWNMKALNPGLFLGLGPCTLPNGVFQPVCSTQANLDQRRALMFENPSDARFISGLDFHDASGRQEYNGLLLSFQRRAANGLSVSTNYTISKCEGHPTTVLPNIGTGWADPNNPDYDYGPCTADRRHIYNLTLGARTPDFDNGALAAVLGNWRVSGIVRANSGAPLTVTTGQDRAMNGIVTNQRANQVLDDPYGPKTAASWLNPAAFAQPNLGSLGTSPRGGYRGPARWSTDMVVSRLVRFGAARQIELRAEVFNLFNTVRLNNPVTNLSNQSFGRILGSEDPRIMQFAVKYGF
jgi:hypothetical protein